MITCPKCGNASLSSNKREDVAFVRIAGELFTATQSGRAADALSDLVVWCGLKAANAMRNPHKCNHCSHTF
jgi:hypothetical protein